MKKYYLGLAVIGLLTLGLTIYVLSLGARSKTDKQTYEKAQAAAESLNNYIADERKIPDSLEVAGVKDMPETIKYEKTSDSEYRFCITYQADRGYGSPNITSTLTGAALSGMYSGDYEQDDSAYQRSTLYLDYFYKKGENCQIIKPRNLSPSNASRFDDPLYELNESDLNDVYQQAYDEYCGANMKADYADYCEMIEGYLADPDSAEL